MFKRTVTDERRGSSGGGRCPGPLGVDRAQNRHILSEGADPRTLADRLGHSRPSTTQDHYLLRSSGRQKDLAEAVEDVILRGAR